jgi:acyl carrier protein
MNTLDKVQEMIAKQLNLQPSDVAPEKEIVKDLGADSLDVVEMLMNLEEEYGITIPDEDAIKIKTVADLVAVIDSNS